MSYSTAIDPTLSPVHVLRVSHGLRRRPGRPAGPRVAPVAAPGSLDVAARGTRGVRPGGGDGRADLVPPEPRALQVVAGVGGRHSVLVGVELGLHLVGADVLAVGALH